MANRLAAAVSPYLLSHADNPVDWWPWGEEAFAEAARRDVPVMVSIGYATCHWCHVMARESFSDPEVAAYLNDNLVAIKVDREEHPEVDAAYLAAASAFTSNLGWPLTVFATPEGLTFYAGTYFPSTARQGVPGFRDVVDAVLEAWREKRGDVVATGAAVRDAVAASRAAGADAAGADAAAAGAVDLAACVARLGSLEDPEFGGLGREPKFPNAPVIQFLLERGARGDEAAEAFARRTLGVLAASGLRDPVEGGFFRYATRRDWTEPHYERMAYDNAQLLSAFAAVGDEATAAGVASWLLGVLRLPDGAFASAQDSESVIDGARNEGGYYARDAAARVGLAPPALDEKVLSGLNGMVIGALAEAGARLGHTEWVHAARAAADAVLTLHGRGAALVRASLHGKLSAAPATLEDFGGLAGGLLRLALACGEVRYAVEARELVEACAGLVPPGGGDPVLAGQGLATEGDPADGASPSGRSLLADAALLLHALTADEKHLGLAREAVAPALALAGEQPSAFGAALGVATRLEAPLEQLVIVGDELAGAARAWRRGVRVAVTEQQCAEFAAAGFELFAGRARAGAYYCRAFVCALPVTTEATLLPLLVAPPVE
ncbi:MAG TPA: DUF255 domain-containing protein [Pseudolysinimonas sp.]|jgi:uncharacterized protein YyaL (SSP411 family)|nr:DUF255 domain-containing protein [Pseudolysinimonas sp.]